MLGARSVLRLQTTPILKGPPTCAIFSRETTLHGGNATLPGSHSLKVQRSTNGSIRIDIRIPIARRRSRASRHVGRGPHTAARRRGSLFMLRGWAVEEGQTDETVNVSCLVRLRVRECLTSTEKSTSSHIASLLIHRTHYLQTKLP